MPMLTSEEPHNLRCTLVSKEDRMLLRFMDKKYTCKVGFQLLLQHTEFWSIGYLTASACFSKKHYQRAPFFFFKCVCWEWQNSECEHKESQLRTQLLMCHRWSHTSHSADLLANRPSHCVGCFGLHICLVHQQQAKENHQSAKPPEDCELFTK